MQSDNLSIARRYLAALQAGVTGAALAEFYSPDVVQQEFPNRLLPQGARRDLTAILAAAERGRQVMSAQKFQITHAVANGNHVALEFTWVGKLAVAFGDLKVGSEMRGHFSTFLEFRDGKIVAQRSYDCFDPW